MRRAIDTQAFYVLLSLMMTAVLFRPDLVSGRDPAAIEARVFHSFTQSVVPLMLPITFPGVSSEGSGGMSLSLVQAVYCSSDASHGIARFLGVLYPGDPPPDKVMPLVGEEDCRESRSATLDRIIMNPAAPYWVGLVEVDVKWTPWQVELTPTRLHATVKSPHPRVDVRLARDAGRAYQTSSISIPAGNGKTVPLHVALAVDGNTLLIDGLVEHTPPAHYAPRSLRRIGETLPPGANAVIAVPHAVANAVFTDYLPGETFPIHLLEAAPAMTVKNPAIKGGRDTYATTSLLGLKDYPDAFNIDVQWSGKDLHLAKLSLSARRMACASDVMCQVKKAGLEALAASMTRLLNAQYKDVPLRSMILQDIIPLKVNDRDIHVRADVLRAESTPTALVLYAALKLILP